MKDENEKGIRPLFLKGRLKAVLIFRKHPNLSMAGAVFVLGLLAIFTRLPTKEGSTTLAGALFGSGAAFIGAWVAERKRAMEDDAAQALRITSARASFTPELSRILAQLVASFDRLIVNFNEASVGRKPPGDHSTSFRPKRPILYPTSPRFQDLPAEDAALLIEFYDSTHDIEETLDRWALSNVTYDVNAYNMLMQMTQNSLIKGEKLIERFCPDQQFSPLMPASGTFAERIQRSMSHADVAMKAHLERHSAK